MPRERTSQKEVGISIHALRGEGDGLNVLPVARRVNISIHALRGEGDPL